MELMELTAMDATHGYACLVNPAQVMIAQAATDCTVLFMTHNWVGDNQLFVEESLDEVAVKWARAMRVEEVE